ncbi:MAG TPA: UDP-N-acetylmuramoyl-tripeptide--D-alanyl-D-alanine ligase [Armatimonadota bacterium]|nr:UDP-N-acetylmuramoyl-tripeptide--D-alanyl-D-alanine ligase [Armatimonadota bacterium]
MPAVWREKTTHPRESPPLDAVRPLPYNTGMATFTVTQVLDATKGQLLISGPQPRFTGVCTDTRALQPGDLFIALKGERVDGHDYLDAAREQGAAGALVQREVPGVARRKTCCGAWTLIEVTDTLYALGELAQYHRRRFQLPVIGITGSAGKTTTKEMTAAILAQECAVLKTPRNENNEVGLPHTLLRLTAEHQAAVVEFGMRGRGQIGYLAALAAPTIGVITNIGVTHLELLGSREEIALAKAELLDEMAPTGVAVLPRADACFALLRAHAPGPVVSVGETEEADYAARAVTLDDDGRARFTLVTPRGDAPVRLGAAGRHQVPNALAAAAAAMIAGASPDAACAGLAAYRGAAGRMHVVAARRGFRVIDDTYNANPDAMRATLRCLAEMPGARKVAILGDMRELGPTERDLHRELGRYAMTLNLDALLAIGDLGRDYVAGADDPRARWYPDHAAAIAAARAFLAPGDLVLVKGSHALAMDRIVAALVEGGWDEEVKR